MLHSVSPSPLRFAVFALSAVLQGWAVVILTRHFLSQLKSRVPQMHWRGVGLLAVGQLIYWLARLLESA